MHPKTVSRTPIWPYIGIVCCLFLLAVLAPRSWQTPPSARFDRPTPRLQDQPAQIALNGLRTSDVLTTAAARPVPNEAQFAASAGRVDRSAPEMPVQRPRVPADVADSDAASHSAAHAPHPLSQLGSASQPAEFAPAVADRVELSEPEVPTPAVLLPGPPSRPELEEEPRQDPRLPRTPRVVEPPAGNVPQIDADEARFARVWPYPAALIEQLRQLQHEDVVRSWCIDLENVIVQLCQTRSVAQRDVSGYLSDLAELAAEGRHLSGAAPAELRTRIVRAAYAVERRTAVWKLIHQVAATGGETQPVAGHRSIRPEFERLSQHMVAGRLGAWRRYLKLDEIQTLDLSGDAAQRTSLARQVLSRMELERVNRGQRQVLMAEPFQDFATALRNWASEPLDAQRLLASIESFEEERRGAQAQRVAREIQLARWSSNRSALRLAETLNQHYRNANLRIAVTDDLLNRLVPKQTPVEEPIEDDFLGAWVTGTSEVSTQLRLVLIPDPIAWRIGIEARGDVTSYTVASKGPASFYSEGTSHFFARKLLLIDRDGVRVRFAETGADSDTQLQWLETEYDDVPVVGWVVRSLALQEHTDRYYEAQQEASARVEQRASTRLDDEVHGELRQFEQDFQDKVLAPLNRLELDPVALDMQTTEQRVVVRSRLAGHQQLGAHTPRPQAPSDSWISVQVHESLLNNTVEQLQLSGRRSDLRTLFREMADAFHFEHWQIPADIPEGVTVQFAVQDPVRVAFEDGRVVVTLRIAELTNGRRRWRNFSARAFYVPDTSNSSADLVRDDVIRLPEGRLRFGDQIAVRAIFSKVFSKTRPIDVMSQVLAERPVVADLIVNQFVIHEGWIGAALKPRADVEPVEVANR